MSRQYRDWGGYGNILEESKGQVRERVDCPVCGEVLDYSPRRGLWSCPRWGAKHYQDASRPRD